MLLREGLFAGVVSGEVLAGLVELALELLVIDNLLIVGL